VDLTKAIARSLGLDVEIRLGTWNEIRNELGAGKIDVVQGMFYTPERDMFFGFSPAHSIVNHVIAGRADGPLPGTMEELAGRSLIVMGGELMDDLAVKMGYGDKLVRVASQEEALSLLASGKEDYALVAQIPALHSIQSHRWNNLRLSGRPVFSAEYCYAFPKESWALRAQFSQGLAAVEATGEYRRIEEKWLAPYTRSGLAVAARYAAIIMLALLVVICLVALWIWSLRKKVDLKTAELSVEVIERRKAEEEVRSLNRELERRVTERTAELESANTELESFAYAVSHDLRAPLRSMEGFSSIIRNRYDGVLDETGIDYLGRIQGAAVRMGELIEALLGLSRVSRLPLVRLDLDLSALAGEIAGELLETTGSVPPSIVIRAGMKVAADAALMRILLVNLMDNAIKYSSRTAEPRIEIGCMEAPDETVFFVRDNGAGFDMAYADRLFTPFQRLHSTKDFPGTGIGLVTVFRIVARHGGRIWPESRPGGGACFFFTLGIPIRP
jgi:signal transduction histidine kinase